MAQSANPLETVNICILTVLVTHTQASTVTNEYLRKSKVCIFFFFLRSSQKFVLYNYNIRRQCDVIIESMMHGIK